MVLCALVAPWGNIPRDQADTAGMLAHLHAFFVDADLLYDDEYRALGMSPLFGFVTDEGVVSNHWPAGATWLQAPGYGLGCAAATGLAGLGIGHGDSMGVIAVLGVRTWAVLVLVAMAWGTARLCAARSERPEGVARRMGWAIAATFVFGTPLFYYAAEAPLRPHLWGSALTLVVVALWWRPPGREPEPGESTVWRTVAMAAVAGLATYVRPQLAPLWLLVIHDAWTPASEPRAGRARRVLLGTAVFAVFPLAHLRMQRWMYGPQLDRYLGDVTHHLGSLLLSTHHGLLPWCPVLALGLLAMARSAALRERGAWILLAIVLWQLWLDSGMRPIEPRAVLGTRTWAGGVSFGPRKLVDVLPLLLPAATSLASAASARGLPRGLAVVVGLACMPTVLLHASAWLDPDATTGGIMGSIEYRAALGRPLHAEAWSRAWSQRALPVVVPLVLALVVALPLVLAAWLARLVARRGAQPREPWRRAAVVALGGMLVVHGWLAVLLVRSDLAREAEPRRMIDAAASMTPAHLATVRRIQAHHQQLRERLGPDAAPPQ